VAQRTTQWERGDQPMTQFSFTAQYDEYGQSQRNVMLAVARGRNYRLPAQLGERYLGTVTKIRYAKRDDSHSYIVDSRRASVAKVNWANPELLRW
jgi:hypothetical protein